MLARRGFTLGSVLMVVAVAVVFAFTLCATSVFHLSAVQHDQANVLAYHLAESALASGVAMLMNNQNFGAAQGQSANVYIPPRPGSPSNWGGYLFFKTDPQRPPFVPWSVNDLANPKSDTGCNNRVVPSYSAHLIGLGIYGTQSVTVETIVHIPQFPYTIGSTGPITSSGGLLVEAVADPKSAANGVSNIPADQVLPASVGSNQNITLGPQTHITGDVHAVGNITMNGSPIQIDGAVQGNADTIPTPSPTIDVTQFDPQTMGYGGIQSLSATIQGQTLSGFNRAPNGLQVTGNLALDGGVVYVIGDVTVSGSVSGVGAVIATGKVTIGEGASLTADNQAAIIAGGDVSLTGSDKSSANFQGLVYTAGNFTAAHISLVGTFLAANPNGSVMAMSDANVLNVVGSTGANSSSKVSFSVPVPTATPPVSSGPSPTPNPAAAGASIVLQADIPYGWAGANGIATLVGYVHVQAYNVNGQVTYAVYDGSSWQTGLSLGQAESVYGQTLNVALGLPQYAPFGMNQPFNSGDPSPNTCFGDLQTMAQSGKYQAGQDKFITLVSTSGSAQSGSSAGSTTTSSGGNAVTWSFDPSTFINPADGMRVDLWDTYNNFPGGNSQPTVP
ncbi:MAG: bactofilin family protein [Candidatus Xenobia bacterium]